MTEPWAWLLAHGHKKIETRSWGTQYKGLVAIHASKGFPDWAIECCFEWPFKDVLKAGGINKPADLPRGVIVAVAELKWCVGTDRIEEKHWRNRSITAPHEETFGDFGDGRFAWGFADVRALPEPITCRGALNLWDVSIDVQREIERQIGETSNR